MISPQISFRGQSYPLESLDQKSSSRKTSLSFPFHPCFPVSCLLLSLGCLALGTASITSPFIVHTGWTPAPPTRLQAPVLQGSGIFIASICLGWLHSGDMVGEWGQPQARMTGTEELPATLTCYHRGLAQGETRKLRPGQLGGVLRSQVRGTSQGSAVGFALKVKVRLTQPCLTLCDTMAYTIHGTLQVKILEWVAFPIPSPRDLPNTDHPYCRQILYQLSHKENSIIILEWVAYPFSSRSSLPRNQTGVSCIAGRFFTN